MTDVPIVSVGLDISLNGTGVSLLRARPGKRYTIYSHKVKKRTAEQLGGDELSRYKYVIDDIDLFIREVAKDDTVTVIGIEPAVNVAWSRGSSMKQIELNMLIKYRLWEAGATIVSPTIQQAKQFVTGYGRAEKSEVRRQLQDEFGVVFPTLDESDAASFALSALAVFRLLTGNNNIRITGKNMPHKNRKKAKIGRLGVAEKILKNKNPILNPPS